MRSEVPKLCIIAVCHNANIWNDLWEKVSEPQVAAWLVSPRFERMPVQAVNGYKTVIQFIAALSETEYTNSKTVR